MSFLRNMASGLRSLFRKEQVDRELDEELRAYQEMAAEEKMKGGMGRKEALRAVRLERGSVDSAKEVVRTGGWEFLLETCWQDLRFSLRMLVKNPGFTTVAVLTLALGIGVNTTLFTAFDSIALKPLPVKNPESVVRFKRWFASGASGYIQYAFSYPEFVYYRDQNQGFSGLIAASWPTQVLATPPAESVTNLNEPREPLRSQCQLVSANYFTALGISAEVGRVFASEVSQAPGANPVIVLSHPFWQRQFNSDLQIANKTLEINGAKFTIIGVTPPDFIGTGNPPRVPDFWAPLATQTQLIPKSDWLHEPLNRSLQLLGRLASGVSLRQAQAEIGVLTRQLAEPQPPWSHDTMTMTLQRATYFGETEDPWFRTFVGGLMAAVGLVLLVACVNLANMLLARAAFRRKEMGTRLALGAGRGRLIRQLLTESVLLGLLGGMAGLLLSLWATSLAWLGLVRLMQSLLGSRILVAPFTPDVRVFVYTFGLSLVTAILFGLWPALQSSKGDLTLALKSEGSASGQPLSRSRFRSFLVGGQVAVSMALLISSGLLLRGLIKSQAANPGFETKSVFLLNFDLGSDKAKATVTKRQMLVRLQALPEVAGVALSDRPPYSGTTTFLLQIEGSQASPKSLPDQTLVNWVSPSYFSTLGIPVVRGQAFTPQEADELLPAAIVSESTARTAWPGEDPVGKHLKLHSPFRNEGDWKEYEVIGVAKDVRFFNLTRTDPMYVYLPTNASQRNAVLIRAAKSPRDTLASVRTSLGALDKSLLPKLGFDSLDRFAQTQKLLPQAAAIFAGILAILALALAAVGIYGVMAYLVAQRTREVGIRMAFGASKKDVLRLIVRQGAFPVLMGAACGLAVSTCISGLLRAILVFPGSFDLLFGLSAFDPATYVGLTAFLAGIALLASWVPARRAMRVDPITALRYE
jgi:predicted permease